MSPGPPAALAAPTPDPQPAAGPPTPADVLRWCAAAAPGLWFPSAHARTTGVPRDSLDDPLWALRQAGLVHVADWVRGLGQGYALTPAGEKALADPSKLIDLRPVPQPPAADDIPPEDADLAHVPDPAAAPLPRPRDPGITAYDRGELTRGAFIGPRPAVLTPVLLVVNAGWFLVGLVTAWRMDVPAGLYLRGESLEVLRRVGAANGFDLLAGEWWRLLTCGVVHVGGLHLAVNLFALAMIGPVAEDLWGRWRFAALYVLAGLAGACAAMALQPAAMLAGASGSIWGILVAVAVWLIRYRDHLPPGDAAAWLRRLALVIGVNAVISLAPGISWQGHLGGAVAGLCGAIFLDLTRPGANRRQLAAGVAGLVALVGLMAGGLAAAFYLSPDWQAIRTRQARVQTVRVPVPAEVVALLEAVGPDRVKAIHTTARVALVARPPDTTRAVQEAAERLRADAARVLETVEPGDGGMRDRFRAYLAEVDRYAELLDDRLDDNRLPTPEECQEVADQFDRVIQAWAAIEGG
jgi:rhomboid protease GluP